MELRGRRELFCREYLKDLNGSQAAARAGYEPSNARFQASRLLAEEEVQDRIAELASDRNTELKVEARDILIELLRMLNSDVAQYVNEDGTVKNVHDIPIDARRMIQSLEVDHIPGVGAIRTKVKLWSKEKGAEMLARHISLFKDKLEVDGRLSLEVTTGVPDSLGDLPL